MPRVEIGIQIFPAGHPLGRIVAPPITDTEKRDTLKFKVRIVDSDVQSVELRFNNLELLNQLGGGRGRQRLLGRTGNSGQINFEGLADHNQALDVVSDKYAITAFDGANPPAPIAILDPFIIICG